MENKPIVIEEEEIFDIKLRISVATSELSEIQNQLHEFESLIRNFVLDDMILEQELAAKYRNFQKAKKNKRKEQKRKGKNYQEPKGLVVKSELVSPELISEDQLRLKQLYRDAMMKVHPDRVEDGDKKQATENTVKLVELYQSQNLPEMELFCSHIFSASCGREESATDVNPTLTYYANELSKLHQNIDDLKAKHTYKVLSTYQRPLDFAQELKDYYKDRIEKLKKRTRKVE